MSNPETVIQNQILLALGAMPGVRVWRNQVGLFYTADGRPIRVGVVGAADISGLLAPHGRRLEIEVKTPTGRQRPEQRKYQAMIESLGGLYIVARCVEDALSPILETA